MIEKIIKETIIEKEISVTEEVSNAITGNKNYLINRLRTSIKNAKRIDIIVDKTNTITKEIKTNL